MKTTRRNLLVAVVFMLGTVINYANVNNISKKIKVVFENVEKGHDLKIKDQEGLVIHRENVSKNGDLVKLFDFSSLDNGTYTIEVEKEYEILIKEFVVTDGNASLKKDSERKIFRPVITNKENKVYISRINFDKTPLNVSVYYNDYLIVEETISSDEKIINKAYKLDEALKGEYKVFVSNSKTSSEKEFKF